MAIKLFPSTSNSTQLAMRLGMPLKPSVILLRWPVVIICAYLLLYPAVDYLQPAVLQLFIVLYVVSNVALYFVREEKFATWSFYYPLVVLDTIALTVSLVSNGYAESNFYIAFFLVIIMSCIVDDPKLRAVGAILACLIYVALLLQLTGSIHPSAFLRTPFLFVVSLYYCFFTQFTRTERNLRYEAEQRSRGQKEILDILSHELRTPLSVITGYAQALQSGNLGPIAARQGAAFAGIIRQSNHLLTMVNSLIDLTRIQSNELWLKQEEVGLRGLLEELKMNYDLSDDKQVPVKWTIAPDLPVISSDKERLWIVLSNLVNNAVKFTHQGEIRVSACCSADKKTFEFEVADTGIGIAENDLMHIFDKFQQADRSSRRNYDGLGLGLHMVKVFTDLSGGNISVQSEVNRGSTFRMTLPL